MEKLTNLVQRRWIFLAVATLLLVLGVCVNSYCHVPPAPQWRLVAYLPLEGWLILKARSLVDE